ncbi:MAG: DUF3810 domain-containing protein [Marinilabiliaceae bacterium]|nr:DUF3810 domain-containing protein [Marinilabiliaceae bacterium]
MTFLNNIIKSKTLYVVTTALLTFGLTELAARFPHAVEQIYSRNIYPFISSILSYLTGWIPFSVTDLFYPALGLFLVFLIVFTILRKLRISQAFKLLLNTVALAYIAFYWLWGFNYYRADLNDRLALPAVTPSTEEFTTAFSWIIECTNQSWMPMDSLDQDEIQQAVSNAYVENKQWLQLDRYGESRPKTPLFSRFWAAAGIGGYYGPFFSEIHTNHYLYPTEYPCVLAHETAHRMGITSEAEANFYAWFVCHQSDDQRLQYSANTYLLRFFIYQARHLPEFKELIQPIRQEVRDDFRSLRAHYRALSNEQIEKAASKANDAYLKTNKVKDGIDDYNGIIKYVMDYRTAKNAALITPH